jgi:N4-gp56 family major capsid protein
MANNLTNAQVWAKELLLEAEAMLSLKKYEGKQGTRSLLVRYDDLTKTAGDKITISILKKLTGAGVSGHNTLEGNEEDISNLSFDLAIDYLRHAIKFDKKDAQGTPYNILSNGKNQLAVWLAEKIETMAFANASTGNDTTIYPNTAYTSVDDLTSSDVMSTAIISRAKAKMKSAKDCYPIRVNGKDYYVMFIDSFQAYNLKQDSAFINAQREAQTRGDSNPIFTGALGIWDGVIIEENDLLVSGTNTNTIRYTKSLICGANAIALGYGQLPGFEVQKKDYGFATGVATDANFGVQPVRFDSSDHAIVAVITASEDPNA